MYLYSTVAKWLVKLLGYNYIVAYRAGHLNVILVALSCKHELLPIIGLSTPIFNCIPAIQQSYHADTATSTFLSQLKASPQTAPKGFDLRNDTIYYKYGLYIPLTSP